MATPPNAGQFLVSLMTAVRQVTGGRPPPTWAKVDKVQQKLGTDNRDAIDAGIRLAVKKNWMRAGGDPPASITLTGDGVKAAGANRPALAPTPGTSGTSPTPRTPCGCLGLGISIRQVSSIGRSEATGMR